MTRHTTKNNQPNEQQNEQRNRTIRMNDNTTNQNKQQHSGLPELETCQTIRNQQWKRTIGTNNLQTNNQTNKQACKQMKRKMSGISPFGNDQRRMSHFGSHLGVLVARAGTSSALPWQPLFSRSAHWTFIQVVLICDSPITTMKSLSQKHTIIWITKTGSITSGTLDIFI